MRPFDGAADDFHDRGNGSDDWNPSRVHSIEEVPIALAMVLITGGDLQKAIFGGANYGRDCDSIAGMAGSITGAMHGFEAVPAEWVEAIDRENRCDMRPLARDLAGLVTTLQARDAREDAHAAELSRYVAGRGGGVGENHVLATTSADLQTAPGRTGSGIDRPDYAERVYAGVLGKLIGVYLGRPFEGWTYERI